MATLFVIKGTDQGKRYELDGPVVGLGRDAANRIRLSDTEVSRRHAELRKAGAKWALVDLGSSNGTLVNGRAVRSVELSGGDLITIGQTQLIFTPGVSAVRSGDLAEKIRMIGQDQHGDGSAIVRTISQGEGSRYLARPQEAGTPWLAGALAAGVMYQASQAISHILDIDELLRRIMELIFQSINADRGCVMLRNPETGEFEPRVVHWREGVDRQETIAISRTIIDYVLKRGEGVLTSDAGQDARFDPGQSIIHFGIREAICVPMQGRHETVGVIYVDCRTPPQAALLEPKAGRFAEDHLKLMIAIAHQAALAVEETRYYQAMVQAERLAAMGQTIATLSHHIKNILQGVHGGSHLIEMGLKEHDESVIQRGWAIVQKNQTKIYNMVMDMLTFSKEREPVMQEADLNEPVRDVVELMQARAAEMGVKLEMALAEDLPKLYFDPEGIHRAVLNVVTNALDAVEEKEGGRVVVETAWVGETGRATVSVSDNGVGIAADQLSQVFSIFASSKGARGTGLGLAVSQKIMREHGGTIQVESKLGEGSRFVLELPAAAAAASGESPNGGAAAGEMTMSSLGDQEPS